MSLKYDENMFEVRVPPPPSLADPPYAQERRPAPGFAGDIEDEDTEAAGGPCDVGDLGGSSTDPFPLLKKEDPPQEGESFTSPLALFSLGPHSLSTAAGTSQQVQGPIDDEEGGVGLQPPPQPLGFQELSVKMGEHEGEVQQAMSHLKTLRTRGDISADEFQHRETFISSYAAMKESRLTGESGGVMEEGGLLDGDDDDGSGRGQGGNGEGGPLALRSSAEYSALVKEYLHCLGGGLSLAKQTMGPLGSYVLHLASTVTAAVFSGGGWGGAGEEGGDDAYHPYHQQDGGRGARPRRRTMAEADLEGGDDAEEGTGEAVLGGAGHASAPFVEGGWDTSTEVIGAGAETGAGFSLSAAKRRVMELCRGAPSLPTRHDQPLPAFGGSSSFRDVPLYQAGGQEGGDETAF